MTTGLESRVAVVTGGAQGIGAAIVRGLSGEGAAVLFADIDADAGTALEKELRGQGADVTFLESDLTQPGACHNVVEETVRRLGSLDILVNNLGVNDHVGLERPTSDFMQSLRLNLVPSFEMVRSAAPHLLKAGGKIVSIASKVAETGQGNTSGYAAAKGALLALTREWAIDFAPGGVTVNAVVPAEVYTPMYERELARTPDPDAAKRQVEAAIPLGRRMTAPDEIASMVVFLCSDKANHITGQHIHVDGGYTHLDRRFP